MITLPLFAIKKHQAYLYLITANVIWGATAPISKWSLGNIDPFMFVFLRFFLASFLLLPLTRHNLRIQKRDYGQLVATSLTGAMLPVTFFFLGLMYTESINAPIIGAAGPIMLLIFASFIFHEKLQKKVIVGTLVSLLGVLLIVFQPTDTTLSTHALLGNAFLLLATTASVIHTFLLKKMITRYSLFALNFWMTLISAIAAMPMALFATYKYSFLPGLDERGIIGILFTVIFASTVAYTLFAVGVHKVKVNETGVFAYIAPIAAAIVALPLLGEKITFIHILGGILIFGGIYIVQTRIKFNPFHSIKST